MKTLNDLKEQIQEDMKAYLDGLLDDSQMDEVCQIIVDRTLELEGAWRQADANAESESRIRAL